MSLVGLFFLTMSYTIPAGTELPTTITSNTVLYKSNSPYLAEEDVTVISGVKLTVQAGVEIRFDDDAGLIIKGEVEMNGSEAEPIYLKPKPGQSRWKILSLHEATGSCYIGYVTITGTTKGNTPSREQAGITAYKSEVVIDHVNISSIEEPIRIVNCEDAVIKNSTLYCNVAGADYLNFFESSGEILNCTFIGSDKSNVDAIDFDESVGLVSGNVISNFYGDNTDGIDAGTEGSILVITNNFIKNISDKGISMGEQTIATVNHNVIINAETAIASKDLAVVNASNNTIYRCDYAYGAFSAEDVQYGGGNLYVKNSIIIECDQTAQIRDNSDLTIDYSISNSHTIQGDGNILDDPMVKNPQNDDFSLRKGSPAIDTGDPTSTPDPDGTRADMGAFYYDQRNDIGLVVNEIHYRPIIEENEDVQFEFIELYNKTQDPIDLSGISVEGAISYTFEASLIFAGDYILLVKNRDNFTQLPVTAYEWDSGRLNNEGEEIIILDQDGQTIVAVDYKAVSPWPELPYSLYYSIELEDHNGINNDPANWRVSKQPGGSPGKSNENEWVFGLYINEFTASTGTYFPDEFGEFADWIEIYNGSDRYLNIGGMYLTDDLSDPQKYEIPNSDLALTTIAPKDYLLIWADNDDEKGPLHTNFTLASGGEEIGLGILTDEGFTYIDEQDYGQQNRNISYGRYPDGTDNYEYFEIPTPLASNQEKDDLIISGVFINEFVASSGDFYLDEHGLSSDWIEIYNSNTHSVCIGGLWFSDDDSQMMKHQILTCSPDSTTIPAKSFLVFRADEKPNLGINHLDFRLASQGESIILSQNLWGYPNLIDSINYPPQSRDISYGRLSDGSPYWNFFDSPTPEKSNSTSGTYLTPIGQSNELSVYPNPFHSQITVQLPLGKDYTEPVQLVIVGISGIVIDHIEVNEYVVHASGILQWKPTLEQLGSMTNGIYFVRLTSDTWSETKKIYFDNYPANYE